MRKDPDNPLQMRGDAVLYLWDGEDGASMFGYHALTNYGVPFGYVFTRLSDLVEENWSVTLSHEALELAMDAEINLLAQGPHPDPDEGGRLVYHWYELCDAVQDETYLIDNIEVSNFVLPLYFTIGDEHLNHNDFLGNRVPSFGVNTGGYVGFFDPETGGHGQYVPPEDTRAINRLAAKSGFSDGSRTNCRKRQDLLSDTNQVYCEAISFELAEGISDHKMANDLVLTHLGDNWQVRPCPGDKTEFDALYSGPTRLGFAAAWQLCHEMTDEPSIEWAEPSFVAPVAGETDAADDDASAMRGSSLGSTRHKPGTEYQAWAINDCKVPEAWELILGAGKLPGRGVTIGHPDSGFNIHSEVDLNRVLLDFDRDFLDNDDDAQTKKIKHGSHGLATASVIMSGDSNLNDRLRGPALHSNIVPLRVTKRGKIRPTPVLFWRGMRRLRDAVDYAAKIECGVISMSLGGFPSRSLHKAIRRATKSGVIVLAAAGNRVKTVVWPARHSETIAVAGSNINREAWKGTCKGKAVDITAPAESVPRATIKKDGTEVVARSSGTSYAVAITAGVAALWRAYHDAALQEIDPALVNELFRTALRSSASKDHSLPEGSEFGAGILDAAALLSQPLTAVGAPADIDFAGSIRGQLSDMADDRADKLDISLQSELLSANALIAVLQVENRGNIRASSEVRIETPPAFALSPRLRRAVILVET